LAGLNVTDKGTLNVDRYTLPFFPTNVALMLRAEMDATAFALPVSVSFQTTAPVELTLLALQDAVMPFGNPETLMDEPTPPVATTAPPTGVSVIVVITEEADGMEIADGEAVNTAPAAGCTCKVKLLLPPRPSPVAVTTKVCEPTGALADAVSVKVSLLVLTLARGVWGLTDHFAVTPAGNPPTE
jgi:hypothetical protein